MIWRIKRFYYDIVDWFKYCCNKRHFKTVWQAFIGRPYDYGYTYSIIRCRLKEHLKYFKSTKVINKEDAEYITSKIQLAINLLDITTSNIETTPTYENLNNAYRYFPDCDEQTILALKAIPGFMSEVKANVLFWKVMSKYSNEWWD